VPRRRRMPHGQRRLRRADRLLQLPRGGRTCGPCPGGYEGSGLTNCTDIDECLTANGGCDSLSTCSNAPGGRTCGPCPTGYEGSGATSCTDINECLTANGGCDPLASCTNTPGSRTCGPCPGGYDGNGASGCVDRNECALGTHGCSINATCTNSPGSYSCTCNTGFTGDGFACEDRPPPVTTASPGGDRTYVAEFELTLVPNEPGTTYFTLDGSAPSATSQVYAGPITISQNTTVRFFSIDLAGNTEAVQTVRYSLDISRIFLLYGGCQ
jgi:hypothetical protein